MTKEERKEYNKAYYQKHKKKKKAYYQDHKEELKAKMKAWKESHKAERSAYTKMEVNSLGQTRYSIRKLSRRYLSQHGTKKPGYEIHHCCTYDEPYKFIYCSRETHLLIHEYLRENNIDAASEHYEQIKHLLDDTVELYGIKDTINEKK